MKTKEIKNNPELLLAFEQCNVKKGDFSTLKKVIIKRQEFWRKRYETQKNNNIELMKCIILLIVSIAPILCLLFL